MVETNEKYVENLLFKNDTSKGLINPYTSGNELEELEIQTECQNRYLLLLTKQLIMNNLITIKEAADMITTAEESF